MAVGPQSELRRRVTFVRRRIVSLFDTSLGLSPEFRSQTETALERQRKGDSLEGARWLLLTLAACEAAGGAWQKAASAAAAIELFLTAGDLFDDIEDGDISIEDVPHSSNVACLLLMLSQKAALGLDDPAKASLVSEAITSAGVNSCIGQYRDICFEKTRDVSEKSWLEMTELRSGALAACACRVGAIVGTEDKRKVEALARFGRLLGVAGQISNDLHILNSALPSSDISRGKKTFPVVFALRNGNRNDRAFLRSFLNHDADSQAQGQTTFKDILMRTGAFHYSTFVAEEYRLKAFRVLADLGLSAKVIRQFELVTTARG